MPASFVICHLQTIVNSYWVIEQIPPPEFRIQNLGWDDFGRWWARLLLVWRNMKFDSKDASKVFLKHLSILQPSFYGIHFWTKFLLQPLLWLAWKKAVPWRGHREMVKLWKTRCHRGSLGIHRLPTEEHRLLHHLPWSLERKQWHCQKVMWQMISLALSLTS